MQVLSWISDLLLITAGLYTVSRALEARWLEWRARQTNDEGKKSQYLEDAKTLVLVASLQQTWVLVALAVGFALKGFRLLATAVAVLGDVMWS